jgi:hypothetical protein
MVLGLPWLWVCQSRCPLEGEPEQAEKNDQKILEPFLDLCVSSLRRGHANLLCIVPILSDVPKDNGIPNHLIYIPLM